MLKFFRRVFQKGKNYTLVISGGGTKGFYALGILKGLEELGFKEKIKVVYGVSIGAIILSYRCSGYSAQEIFNKFIDFNIFGLTKINFYPKVSLLKNSSLKDNFEKDLPNRFEKLDKILYVGATNINTGKFVLFNKGDMINPLLGSMAIPGIFPYVKFKNYNLIDGGATNNFPVDIARKQYPKNKIIGINLNKFTENQEIKTIFDTLSISLDILLRNRAMLKSDKVNYLFYNDTGLKILDTKSSKMKKAFEKGYTDCIQKFK
ncbi:MAG: patatin-like phospholipase family protein [Candidatus Absconditicoccaceae bacterium]